mgnify:CR=1 FL=1
MDQLTSSGEQQLPNATLALVLGILSIVLCGIGIVLGVIGLVVANKDIALFRNNPGQYAIASYNNVRTGRICSIIGLILSALVIILYAGIIVFAISAASFNH